MDEEKQGDLGEMIKAADAICDAIEAHEMRLGKDSGHLVHMVVMTWINRLAARGLANRSSPRVDRLTRDLAEMAADAWVRAQAVRHG